MSASTGSLPKRVPECVCLRPVEALGTTLRSGECAAHSCFFAHFSGRSMGGWEDRLLTASSAPPAATPPFATGAMAQKKKKEERISLNFTRCPRLLSSHLNFTFEFSVPLLCISVICFPLLTERQPSLRFVEFVYFHECVSDCWLRNAAVREAPGWRNHHLRGTGWNVTAGWFWGSFVTG